MGLSILTTLVETLCILKFLKLCYLISAACLDHYLSANLGGTRVTVSYNHQVGGMTATITLLTLLIPFSGQLGPRFF